MRHPDNENGELLQHCGPWPLSCAGEKPTIGMPLAFDYPGAVAAQAKHGLVTLCRFDGDNGEYSLLLGTAKGIDGPYTKGTYLWVEGRTGSAWKPSWWKAPTSTTAWASTRTWCPCCMRPANTWE